MSFVLRVLICSNLYIFMASYGLTNTLQTNSCGQPLEMESWGPGTPQESLRRVGLLEGLLGSRLCLLLWGDLILRVVALCLSGILNFVSSEFFLTFYKYLQVPPILNKTKPKILSGSHPLVLCHLAPFLSLFASSAEFPRGTACTSWAKPTQHQLPAERLPPA